MPEEGESVTLGVDIVKGVINRGLGRGRQKTARIGIVSFDRVLICVSVTEDLGNLEGRTREPLTGCPSDHMSRTTNP